MPKERARRARDQEGKEGDYKGKDKGKDQKSKGLVTCGKPSILLETVGGTILDR